MTITPGPDLPPSPGYPHTTTLSGGSVDYAGLWLRFAAYFIDLLIMGVIGLPARAALLQSRSDGGALAATVAIVLIIHAVYLIGFWTSRGQTIGMRLMKLRLQRADSGGPIDLKTASVRFIPFGLALLVAFIAWAIWIAMAITVATGNRHQGFQDRIAGTVVVRE
ncbi:MAG: RDD family protein [Candidatus Dormibacteria bacterium]